MGAVAMSVLAANAVTLERELAWAERVIDAAIRLYFRQSCAVHDVRAIAAPPLADDASPYARLVDGGAMAFEERLVLALALAPHLKPHALDPFLMRNTHFARAYTEFGGVQDAAHPGFWPTVQTAAFVLAGADIARRLAVKALFDEGHVLVREQWIEHPGAPPNGNLFNAALRPAPERLAWLTSGAAFRPAFSSSFPARRLTSDLEWNELVLARSVAEEVEEIKAWIAHRGRLAHEWRLGGHLKPGYRSLFYGPPGTGKTLTATLLGKETGLDVYRVDLSMVVSKYIGETEKNLAAVFEQAARNDWILFFDEADALFGRRTQASGANERYANQEVAYLLQRLEDFPGIVILASNLKGNIDEAFARRFQSMIYFPPPKHDERVRLWHSVFAQPERLAPDVDLHRIAAEFDLAGGAVINVLRYAALMALRRGAAQVSRADIEHGVRRELRKEGKIT
jgi:hypothetical protein